jgi:hypothetical protein
MCLVLRTDHPFIPLPAIRINHAGSPVAETGKDLVAGIRAVEREPGGEAGVERAIEDSLIKKCLNGFLKYVNAHRYVR